MDDKKYAISVNKPRRSVRIHLMTCGSRKVHMNKKGNQIHIEDLNLETARKINESYEYEDKNFCDLCLRELRKEHTSTIKTQDKSSSKEKRDHYTFFTAVLGVIIIIAMVAYFLKDGLFELEQIKINSKEENKAIISEIQKKEKEIEELKTQLVK